MAKVCSVEGCMYSSHAQGYCSGHYDIWRRTGSTTRTRRRRRRGVELQVVDNQAFCCACEKWLPVAEFAKDAPSPNGLTIYCRPCGMGVRRNWMYGGVDLLRILHRQGGVCAICETPIDISTAHVDHNHACCPVSARSCGSCVRGLLCGSCNPMLGHAKDSVDVLQRAVKYLVEREFSGA